MPGRLGGGAGRGEGGGGYNSGKGGGGGLSGDGAERMTTSVVARTAGVSSTEMLSSVDALALDSSRDARVPAVSVAAAADGAAIWAVTMTLPGATVMLTLLTSTEAAAAMEVRSDANSAWP